MKLSIIGLGRVGGTLAYTLAMKELAAELVLVSHRPEKAEADALDLEHAQLFRSHPMQVSAGGLEDTADSEVVAFCASKPWKEGFSSRLSSAAANTELLEEVIPTLARVSPNAKLVMVSNPVDVLTYHAIRLSGFAPSRVMGTGTLIDSARFREMLSKEVGIHPADLRAYVLGEHGDSQFAAMSAAEAGGEPIEDTPERRALADVVRLVGVEVFRKKGYTNFAVASAAAHVIESIVTDARHTMPLSVLVDGFAGVEDVCLSLPVVVGHNGVERVLNPKLNDMELKQFRDSAAVVRGVIDQTF